MRTTKCLHARFAVIGMPSATQWAVECRDCPVKFSLPVGCVSAETPLRLPLAWDGLLEQLTPEQRAMAVEASCWHEPDWYHRLSGKERTVLYQLQQICKEEGR